MTVTKARKRICYYYHKSSKDRLTLAKEPNPHPSQFNSKVNEDKDWFFLDRKVTFSHFVSIKWIDVQAHESLHKKLRGGNINKIDNCVCDEKIVTVYWARGSHLYNCVPYLHDFIDQCWKVGTFKCFLSTGHFIKNTAQGPNVTLVIVFFTFTLQKAIWNARHSFSMLKDVWGGGGGSLNLLRG